VGIEKEDNIILNILDKDTKSIINRQPTLFYSTTRKYNMEFGLILF
jgi:hypothetical protein